MEGNPTAGENFRHPAPREQCRLPTVGIPCKTTVHATALNSGGADYRVLSTESDGALTATEPDGALTVTEPVGTTWSSLSLCSLSSLCPCSCVSCIDASKVGPPEPEASAQSKVGPWPINSCSQKRILKTFGKDCSSEEQNQHLLDDHHVNDDQQRVLDIGEDSSSDESYIGQSNVLASSSSEEDHDPVVFAPLEVGDPFAGFARATSGHSDSDKNASVDDARMDPLVQ